MVVGDPSTEEVSGEVKGVKVPVGDRSDSSAELDDLDETEGVCLILDGREPFSSAMEGMF